jgi:hypothetical protein
MTDSVSVIKKIGQFSILTFSRDYWELSNFQLIKSVPKICVGITNKKIKKISKELHHDLAIGFTTHWNSKS